MHLVSVDYLWVFVAAISQMVLGSLWYSPLLFGKQWMKLVGITEKDMQGGKNEMKKAYISSYIVSLVSAYVLAVFIQNLGIVTAAEGAKLGFWLWLGFIGTSSAQGYIFSPKKKSWALYFFDNGYMLVGFMIMGAILAYWG